MKGFGGGGGGGMGRKIWVDRGGKRRGKVDGGGFVFYGLRCEIVGEFLGVGYFGGGGGGGEYRVFGS